MATPAQQPKGSEAITHAIRAAQTRGPAPIVVAISLISGQRYQQSVVHKWYGAAQPSRSEGAACTSPRTRH